MAVALLGLVLLSGGLGYLLGHAQGSPVITLGETGSTYTDIVTYCQRVYYGEQPPLTIPFWGQYPGTYGVYVCRLDS